jgi:hypothetical protein
MSFITTIDVIGLTPAEYRGVLDRLEVETRPEPAFYLHLAAPLEGGGYRITEVWESKEGFDAFMQRRLAPAAEAEHLQRDMRVNVEPLHNIFAPRLRELPGLVNDAPGRRRSAAG